MGELAAGMAHEINQPLTAVLANTQAAVRLLSEDSPEVAQAKNAMAQAVNQAKRASDVVSRLRRLIEQPNEAKPLETVSLADSVSNALHLLAPELHRHGIAVQIKASEIVVIVMADPIALEQIIHNLLLNAVQALEQVPANERHLVVNTEVDLGQGVLTISDTGPGIAVDALPRLFEPFFSTRADGLGLGLSLCESLANRMGGELSAKNHMPRGASFILRLTLERP
jgi:C4-dicarboxylate-specific signal transduction histidine kinase